MPRTDVAGQCSWLNIIYIPHFALTILFQKEWCKMKLSWRVSWAATSVATWLCACKLSLFHYSGFVAVVWTPLFKSIPLNSGSFSSHNNSHSLSFIHSSWHPHSALLCTQCFASPLWVLVCDSIILPVSSLKDLPDTQCWCIFVQLKQTIKLPIWAFSFSLWCPFAWDSFTSFQFHFEMF